MINAGWRFGLVNMQKIVAKEFKEVNSVVK
jgi:hypothetical protein